MRSLNIKNKQVNIEYENKSSERTGVIFGKGSEKVVVYNKSLKHKSDSLETRIEVQLTGQKRPCKTILELEEILKNGYFPFNSIELFNAKLNEPKFESQKIQNQFKTFESLFSRDGYYSARRKLNKDNNFSRDYMKFLTIESPECDLQEQFRSQMNNYFKEEEWKYQKRN